MDRRAGPRPDGPPVRAWSRVLLAAYLAVLLWVVLFKLSYDVVAVVRDYRTRSLNLLPFAGVSWAHDGELISNVVVFLPLGVLLGVVLTRLAWWWKLAVAFLVSVALETTQYVLAIGTTDITDVITNTLGALVGLVLYDVAARYVAREKLDRVVVVAGTVLLVAGVLLRVLVLRVKYV
jgi:glycopeptide antibiotics resistance protein